MNFAIATKSHTTKIQNTIYSVARRLAYSLIEAKQQAHIFATCHLYRNHLFFFLPLVEWNNRPRASNSRIYGI